MIAQLKRAAFRSPGKDAPVPARRAKLSINVSTVVSERLRDLAYRHRLSESSIVEVALKNLFGSDDDSQLGALLRQRGATLRSR